MDLLLLVLLPLFGCCAGQDILPVGPVDAILGRNVTLQTLVDKPVFVFMIWNFNDGTEQVHVATASQSGLKVNAPYQGRVEVNNTNGFLFLKNLKSEDSGDYSLSIISADGSTKTAEIKLRVLEPVSAVAIKSSLPEAIEHNSTVVLTCSAKGSFLKFAWLKGAVPLVADGMRITLAEAELSSTLTVRNVLRTDLTGSVFCTASNKLETEKSAAFNLTVYYGPEAVTISPLSPPQFLRSRSPFNLTCASDSNPVAKYTWFHNQDQMENSGPVLTLDTIEKLGLGKQTGQFSCRATNTKTLRSVASPAVSFAVMEPISGVTISGPTATLIAGNSSANISCKAAAGTVKTRTWQKDGKPLLAGGRVEFSSDMSSVTIGPLQKDDGGLYVCHLANPVNTDSASYRILVNYGPDAAAVTGESAVEVNDQVTLTCSADSAPSANYTWRFNGTLTDVRTSVYKMEMVRYKNSGTYTCEASNAVTGKTAKFTHSLSVKEEGTLDDGLSDGAIAGIVIAILVALGAAIGTIIYCRQKVPVESPY